MSSPTPYHQPSKRPSPSTSRALPKRNSSFNSKARQQAYLDQKRRQRVLSGSASSNLGDSSHNNNNVVGSPNNSSRSIHRSLDHDDSLSHHDPIHMSAPDLYSTTPMDASLNTSQLHMSASASFHSPEVRNSVSNLRRKFSSSRGSLTQPPHTRARYTGHDNDNDDHDDDDDNRSSESEDTTRMDPLAILATRTITSKKAAATGSKFVLTPPARLLVDQSVNLMDVETGNYEFETSGRAEKIRSKFLKELGQSPRHPSATTSTTTTPAFGTSFLHNTTPTTGWTTTPNPAPRRTSISQFWSHFSSSAAGGDTSAPSSVRREPYLIRRDDDDDPMGTSHMDEYGGGAAGGGGGGRTRMMSILLDPLFSSNTPRSAEITITRPTPVPEAEEREPDVELGSGSNNNKSSDHRPTQSRSSSSRRRNKSKKALAFPDGYDPNLWEQRAVDAKSQPLLVPTDIEFSDANDDQAKRARRARRKARRRARLRKLRPGRVACFLFGLFVLLTIVLLILVLTGELMLTKWKKPSTVVPPPVLVERNHTYLYLPLLPQTSRIRASEFGTAQFQALDWLRNDPQTTVVKAEEANWTTTFGPMDTLAAIQKFVLLTLYYQTDGERWKAPPDSWMDLKLNECQWFDNHNEYTICNRYHQLHSLPLPGVGLQGQLPTEELTLLSSLRHVDWTDNQLTGQLPSVWFQSWRNLEDLSVQHNHFTGPLPSELGLLTNSNGLRSLNFNENQFSGSIPRELGHLMNRLVSFEAMSNRLSGSIPPELVGPNHNNTVRALERLKLNHNLLTGVIPSELGLLTQLTALTLHANPKLDHQMLPREICDLPLLSLLTVDCDIVTCPDDCDCTCEDSGSNNAVPVEESHAVVEKSAAEDDDDKKKMAEQSFADMPEGEIFHEELVIDHRPGWHANAPEPEAVHGETNVKGNSIHHVAAPAASPQAEDETRTGDNAVHTKAAGSPKKIHHMDHSDTIHDHHSDSPVPSPTHGSLRTIHHMDHSDVLPTNREEDRTLRRYLRSSRDSL